MSKAELERLEITAKAWGRTKTEFARELLCSALNDLAIREPKTPLPAGR